MKRILLVLLVAVMTANLAFAQIKIGGKEGRIGFRAGVNLAKLAGDLADYWDEGGYDIKYKPGIQLGVVVEFPMKNEKFVIQPGILFSQTGAKYKISTSMDMNDSKMTIKDMRTYTLNYLQVPVNFLYKHDLGGSMLLLQAGPYLGYAIGGKNKTENSTTLKPDPNNLSSKKNDSKSIKFGSDKDKHDYKAFDLGFGLGAGLMFNEKIQAGLSYNLGLSDIGHYRSAKNRFISFTLTYLIGK